MPAERSRSAPAQVAAPPAPVRASGRCSTHPSGRRPAACAAPEVERDQWLGFALTEACFFYGLVGGFIAFSSGRDARRSHIPMASRGSFLITPNVGLMVWTMWCRCFAADPAQVGVSTDRTSARRAREDDRRRHRCRCRAARGRRQAAGRIPRASEGGRAQSRDPPACAPAADSAGTRPASAGQEILAEAAERAEREIDAAAKRALDDIRKEVTDLTIMATEKVTRKRSRRRSAPPGRGGPERTRLLRASPRVPRQLMEELAQVYARSLSRRPSSRAVDELREQLGQFADALDKQRGLAVFFFSPTSRARRSRSRCASCSTARTSSC